MDIDEYRRMAETEMTHWWYRATRSLLQQVLDPLLPRDGRLLDAGCGTGATGAWLRGHGRLVASDREPAALALYHERHPHDGLVRSDLGALPFRDGAFDAVLCVTVLYHRAIGDPGAAVRELARVVRPGGVLCLMEPGVRRLRRAHDAATHGARRFGRGDLAGLLRDAGLSVERATGAYAFLVPPAAVKAVLERGRAASDLAEHESGLHGLLGRVAGLERRWLAGHDLPFGLSVVAVGRAPI